MDTKYSLTTLLNNLLLLQNNSYNIIASLSEIVSSNADTVSIPLVGPTGAIQSVIVPSFGSLKNQMVRLENNIESLAGVGNTNSSIQLADGSFRTLLVSSLQKEAADIQNMSIPKVFNTKENWFFESFLNPLLYVTFDLTNQVPYIDTPAKQTIFNTQFLNESSINYQTFAQSLIDNNITYYLDDEITSLPPRTVRYFGKFSVTNITDDTVTSTVDSVTFNKRVLRLRLDTLQYNDTKSQYLGTVALKIGDQLVVNSGSFSTLYQINNIDTSTRTVSVTLIQGFDPIQIGTGVLSIYTEDQSPVSVNVNIGFNEYCVLFIKPIDPNSKIEAANWSPGVGFYTNNLNITDSSGTQMTLATYYQNEVVDFGAYLYSLAKDSIVPSSLGIAPNPPTLNASNFQVVQVNKNITDTSNLTQLQTLQSNKLTIQSNMAATDASIASLTTKLQTTNYATQQLKDTDVNALSNLVNQRNSQASLYASTVANINALATSTSIADATPEYRVRGFFPMPLPQTSSRTGDQQVVQFVINYRYLNANGGANQPEQLPFIDNDGTTVTGTFSNWIEVKSDVLERTIDVTTGNSTWITEDVTNADVVNINTIDIPIKAGESVQFRVKSLSEAGWPVSPAESAWTDPITIEFPANLSSLPDVTSIIESAQVDQARIDFQNDLQNIGVPQHVASSITQNGSYFAHPATQISSGFLSPEQVIISLYDKLVSMDAAIAQLQSQISNIQGVLVVTIVDSNGNEYSVSPNTTVKLFAGNYRDQVSSLTIKKGVIVTQNYFIKITNSSASALELYSRTWGSKTSIAQPSYVSGTAYNGSDTDYNSVRKYDYVPIGLSNPSPTDLTYPFVNLYPDSSSQCLGQFIQSRYISIDGSSPLYGAVGQTAYGVYGASAQINGGTPYLATKFSDIEYTANMNSLQDTITISGGIGSTANGDFIWRGATSSGAATQVVGATDSTVLSVYANTILLHIEHPDISNFMATSTPNNAAAQMIRNSMFGNLQAGQTGSNLQTPFTNFGLTAGITNPTNKVGFEPNDQYLLGPLSVGSYLFLNPNSYDDTVVDGSDSLSVTTINFGESNAISIPVTFQYRMTDYYGSGDSGLGNLGGNPNSASGQNLTYTKTLGIDLYTNPINKNRFSFDIQVTARYYSKTLTTADVPSKTFQNALGDLNNTLKTILPQTSRDVTPPSTFAAGQSNKT